MRWVQHRFREGCGARRRPTGRSSTSPPTHRCTRRSSTRSAAAAGTRLLDAGCGAGLALQLAHKRGATVTGLDAAAALLGVAPERVPTADLREGELEALPYPDDSFDTVTAFNAVQYAADTVAALRELRAAAAPTGQRERAVRAERAGEAGGAGRCCWADPAARR